VKFLVHEIFSCAAKLVWHFYDFSIILVNFAISLFYRKREKMKEKEKDLHKEKGLHRFSPAHNERPNCKDSTQVEKEAHQERPTRI
jgi:hypothetical protein